MKRHRAIESEPSSLYLSIHPSFLFDREIKRQSICDYGYRSATLFG
jgi:hypothetical protein